ncbi:hypothetical protein P775_07800 [Puniceibacterium antarcticum]|uniref:Uncharacterized protein n=1 Tax=Puniceibacterium antarcticum TaxID=1206336 RepID=A0A2G8RGR8_9RHOB|nr:hypothetical protein P775_07800 [Puniceibacterium antarcticum]
MAMRLSLPGKHPDVMRALWAVAQPQVAFALLTKNWAPPRSFWALWR